MSEQALNLPEEEPQEIVWGALFADLFQYSDGGLVSADLQRLSDVEQAGELG